MNERVEAVIFCEGYHDRAFWMGWLLSLGCTDPGIKPGKAGRSPVIDPFDSPVRGGTYAYYSPGGHFIRVQPCQGKDNILPLARRRLKNHAVEPVRQIILNVDSDLNADGSPAAGGALGREAVVAMLQGLGIQADVPAGDTFPLDEQADLSLLRWETADPAGPARPNQQTLERLVCCALCAAYPERAAVVQKWLDARPSAPAGGVKEFTWSHMAGWYAEHGCEDFYRYLWYVEPVRAELESRLQASGAWDVVQRLLR